MEKISNSVGGRRGLKDKRALWGGDALERREIKLDGPIFYTKGGSFGG